MCGIIACLGTDDCIHTILDGLESMQNRGYDSVGVSTIHNNELHTVKLASTSTHNAFQLVKESVITQKSTIAIGHTRWATHGGKTDMNAHPHHDDKNRIALVHNGIIENFTELKTMLLQKGYTFRSQTDTEVIAVLIGMYLDQNMSISEAIQHALH
jgi:glucosamine--fructose-6-phosphate aminotransferase (isomerizing)